jgi:hypothetical protein
LLPPTGEPPNHETRVAATPQSARPSISSAQSSPQTAIQPLTPANQPKQPQKTTIIFQEIDIQRAPKFAILGAVSVQDLRYQLLSELRVGEPDDKGVRSVGQLVYDTRLVKSDDLSRAMFEESLRALKGWQFTYKLNRRGEVIEWTTGPTAGRKAAPVEPKGAKGFLVISVLDEDGWKEMAQLSFFVPEEQTAGSQTWSRQMTHDFGPLGHWYGETSFLPKETHNGVLRVDYVHHMTYKSPDKDRGDLPFAIKDALFKAEMAGGTISFDTHARRIQTAQEHFLVKGTISTDILGQATTVQVEEQQAITIRILEQNPWGQ